MDIIWHGRTCFTIKSKAGTVVTDPFKADFFKGKLKADVVLSSQQLTDEEFIPVDGAKRLDWPGEYDVSEIPIIGIQAWNMSKSEEEVKPEDKKEITVFTFDVDGIRVCHLGNLGHKLTDDLMANLQNIDVLLVPVGGKHAMDAKKAHEVIEEIEPSVVIPMYYKFPGEKLDIDPIEAFLKQVGVKEPVVMDKYTVTSKASLPQDHTDYVVLKPVLE